MSKGEVAQVGTGKDVYHAPRTRFVANFLGEANLIELSDLAEGGARDRDGALVVAGTEDRRGAGTLCVRPEMLSIGEAAEGVANRRRARVTNVVFRGPLSKLMVLTDGGQSLSATMLSNGAHVPDKGDMVTVGWSPESASLLRQGE